MSGSTEFLANSNNTRPSATKTQKANVINHFQQNSTPTQKAPSSGPVKSNFLKPDSIHMGGSAQNQKPNYKSNDQYKSDSRTTIRNHVQFVLPLTGSVNSRSNTPTKTDNNFFTHVLTPTNSNSSLNNRLSEFKNLNASAENEKRESSKSIGHGLNRLSDTARLKNLTSIRSSSFRGKSTIPTSTSSKYEPSSIKASYNMQSATHTNSGSDSFHQKSRSSKSYDSINTMKDTKSDSTKNRPDQHDTECTSKSTDTNRDSHTHTIHRLIKMATNWSSSSKSKSSKADPAGKNKYIMSDRSLISQTKIRKTQAFLGHNGNKMDAESAMSRKMAEITDKSIKVVSQPSFEEAFSDAMSDKSVRVFQPNNNRMPSHPIRILPMYKHSGTEGGTLNSPQSKKSIANILRDSHNFSNNNHKESTSTTNNSYWSAHSHNDMMPVNDAVSSISAKESSISSYLSKNKSISFMHLNKNLNSAYKTQSGSNGGLNRIPQGVPIHIQ